VSVEHAGPTTLLIQGRGLYDLERPVEPLNCQRSGTTMRLLAGILAGQSFTSILSGAPQLLRRPMRRITEPLNRMGADIEDTEGHGPLKVRAVDRLRGHEHTLKVASAQVKSAILLAGLYADGPVIVNQPGPARDHTERMLAAQIVPETESEPLTYDLTTILLDPEGVGRLRPITRVVPGDISSAAFLIVAALLLPRSEVSLVGVGVNPTRTGLLDVLRAMGADVVADHRRDQGGEPIADLTVRASSLAATEVAGDTVVRMIDEFPILAVAATQAAGTTVVRDAAELRVKETDRIATVAAELQKMGAQIEPRPDGFVVEGPTSLVGAEVESHGDHRLGMALAVAGLLADGETTVYEAASIADSFPGFTETMRSLGADIRYGV
jgi:3-phosphoshikimate 1-carboxyvinyltransferase